MPTREPVGSMPTPHRSTATPRRSRRERLSNAAVRIGAVAGLVAAQAVPATALAQDERRNYFDDPFLQATSGLPGCPIPEGPLITLQEMRAQAHGRVDRGTTCYRSGRCRLPNAYLYDKELLPRVRTHLAVDERFANSSVWILGQRRWVYLKGCAASQEQADAIERAVREVDDVEAVIPELMIGTTGRPRYAVAVEAPASPGSAAAAASSSAESAPAPR